MSKVTIISHYDADGYASHYLLREFLRRRGHIVRSCFAEFLSFGVEKDLGNVVCWDGRRGVEAVRGVDEVWVLDLGSEGASLRNVLSVFDGVVHWVDHHLCSDDFESIVLEIERVDPNLINESGCTTSLIAQYILKEDPDFFDDEYMVKVAFAGVAGDGQLGMDMSVRDEYKVTALVVSRLLEKHGVFVERGLYGGRLYPTHVMLGAYLNALRRMLVLSRGRLEWLGLRFLDEVRRAGGDIFQPSGLNDRVEVTLSYPAIRAVLETYYEYLNVRNKLFDGEGVDLLKVREGLIVAVISMPYDVGGIYATHLLRSIGKQYENDRNSLLSLKASELGVSCRSRDAKLRLTYDALKDLFVGVAIVFNRGLGTVSLRGMIPFVNLADVARKYFGGGGHRVAAAGSFEGSARDFVRFVNENILPLVRSNFMRALENWEDYMRWRNHEAESVPIEEL